MSSKRNDPLHAGLKTRIEPSPDEQPEPSFHNTLLSNILLTSSQLNDYLTRTVVNNFPIKIDTLDALLTAHPNRVKVNYVVRGLRDGFRIGCKSDNKRLRSAETNCWSALGHPEVTDKYLGGKIQACRAFGLFDVPRLPNLHVCRFAVIPK